MTVALFLDPWEGLAEASPSLRRPRLLWRKAMWFKANPRSLAYMRALLAEHFPDATLLDVRAEPDWERALGSGPVVLLYPDAIGIGFGAIERRLLGRVPVTVLNGRRRNFALDRATRRRLRLRRFLERTMLLEGVFGLGLLIATPFLLGFDLARGRR
jgi:hypothetical protein